VKTLMTRIALSSLVATALAAAPTLAHADDDEATPVKEGTLIFSLDYLLGVYPGAAVADGMGTGGTIMEDVTQSSYVMGFRGTMFDWTKKTPLGAVPGVWFDLAVGWNGSTGEGREFADEGGSGLIWNSRMAGPWKIMQSKNLKVGAGIGFTFGIQMGMPGGTGRVMEAFAFDAFAMAVAEVRLGGLKTMFEADYAVGVGYNEQRVYGHVALGKLAIGGVFLLGQADTNYTQIGVNLGYRFNTEKF